MLVFITNLFATSPVFHRAPDWYRGEGCIEPYHHANVNRLNGQAVDLPDRVVAPCGQPYLAFLVRGSDGDRRPEFTSSGVDSFFTHRGRMHFQHSVGTELPRRHAEKFARPCKRCFTPKEGT